MVGRLNAVAASQDGTVAFWGLEPFELLAMVPVEIALSCLACSPDGAVILTGDGGATCTCSVSLPQGSTWPDRGASRRLDRTDETLTTRQSCARSTRRGAHSRPVGPADQVQGEERPPSGPIVEGTVRVDDVAGYAAAACACLREGGRYTGRAEAKRVERGGEIVAVDELAADRGDLD